MPVSIPDEWLLNSARAGITLCRCSYRGLEPTYQIGEGAYTKIPERSHALFPVAQYEFIWAHQLWNLTEDSDVYFQYYLDKYVLPNGDFLYNTQDRVEAPLNIGIFLANSARSFDYTRNVGSLQKRLPVLDRTITFALARYEYSKQQFPAGDRRHGLIYGSPEADLGDPANDFPNSHPFYYQNSAWIWRGLSEHSRCLRLAAPITHDAALAESAAHYEVIAKEMRENIRASLDRRGFQQMLTALDTYHGQPNGMFSCDEHFAGRNPSQGSELCTVVEMMFSLEQSLAILGNATIGDRLEKIAFNALPGTFTDDMWAHQYTQQANQVEVSLHRKPWTTDGAESNLFGLEPNFGCCAANFHQGWPKFAASPNQSARCRYTCHGRDRVPISG